MSKKHKIRNHWINLFVAVLFLLMAIFQINDPDPYLWIMIYAVVMLIPTLYYFKIYFIYLVVFLCIILGIYWTSYIPELGIWIDSGRPSLVNEMKAESSSIELVRELGGLTICLACLIFYMLKIKSAKR